VTKTGGSGVGRGQRQLKKSDECRRRLYMEPETGRTKPKPRYKCRGGFHHKKREQKKQEAASDLGDSKKQGVSCDVGKKRASARKLSLKSGRGNRNRHSRDLRRGVQGTGEITEHFQTK